MVSDLSTIIVSGRLEELKQQAAEIATLPVAINYVVNPFSAHEATGLLQHLFTAQQLPPFTITFDFAAASSEHRISKDGYDTLCLALAHPQYQKINNSRVLYISGVNGAVQPALDDLAAQLQVQGYNQVAIQDLHSKEPGNRLLFIDVWNEDTCHGFYTLYRNHVIHSLSPLPVFVQCKAVPLPELLQCRDKADLKMQHEEGDLFHLVRQIRHCTAELARCRQSGKLTAEELKSKKDYLDFLLGKVRRGEDFEFSDTVRLKRFYEQEYEVLPLWYKQFGHVIKVLMGKRTLKSLWRDDVKKYR